MHAAVGANHTTHLADLERVCSVLKRLLHLTRTEVTQVAAVAVRGAVRVLLRKLCELGRVAPDLGLVSLEDRDSLVFGAGNVGL